VRRFTGTSLTNVPLRLSRSSITKCSASRSIWEWRRETEASATQRVAEVSRPMTTGRSSIVKTLPLSPPEMAVSRGFIRVEQLERPKCTRTFDRRANWAEVNLTGEALPIQIDTLLSEDIEIR